MNSTKLAVLFMSIAITAIPPMFTSCSSGDDDEEENYFPDGDNSNDDKKLSGVINGHEAVDLGLSVKWASCNYGASSSYSYGNYYAWGETSTRNSYYRDSYKYYNPKTDRDNDLMNNIQGSKYDVAKNWGGSWRMPSKAEFEELVNKCTWKWTTVSGTNGYKVTGSNGISIFLPANGSYFATEKGAKAGIWGEYWTGTFKNTTDFYSHAYALTFTQSKKNIDGCYRYVGLAIRPVTTSAFSSSSQGGNNGGGSTGGGGNTGGSTSYEKPDIAFDDFTAYQTKLKVVYKIYNKDKAKVTSAKVYYGTSSNPTKSVSATVSGVLITANISGLNKGTTYYVKCVATGKGGTTTTGTTKVITNY